MKKKKSNQNYYFQSAYTFWQLKFESLMSRSLTQYFWEAKQGIQSWMGHNLRTLLPSKSGKNI